MEFLNETLNDNNVSTNLYEFLGESSLGDTFGNLCSELDQPVQTNLTNTFSIVTEGIHLGSCNDQNSAKITLESSVDNRTNTITLVPNEWDLRTNNVDNLLNQQESDFSGITCMNNNKQTDYNCAKLSSKASALSDNDSDSGICSSSVSCNSGLSLKDMLNYVAIHDESSQIYSSSISSVIELDNSNQDLVDQLIKSNDIDFDQLNNFDQIPTESTNDNRDSLLINTNDENANTEHLLDSIEQMLKSMENPMENKQAKILNQTNTNLTNSRQNYLKIIKIEPSEMKEFETTYQKSSPKILPKLCPKPFGLAPKVVQPIGKTVRILQPNSISSPIILPVANDGLNTSNPLINTILIENVNTLNSNDKNFPKNKKMKNDAFKAEPLQKTPSLQNATDFSQRISSLPNSLLENLSDKMSFLEQQTTHLDPSLAKKQSRMIKNRESACLSRKRKKEYVQTLEESLEEEKNLNKIIRAENQTMKDRILVLETENKLLRDQNKINNEPDYNSSIKASESNKQRLVNGNSTNSFSLKRPFIMMAVFFVFGLNIFQFINVNLNNSPDLVNNSNDYLIQRQLEYTPSQLAASLAVSDGALVDLKIPLPTHVKSRHLLSEDYEYLDELETYNERKKHEKNNMSYDKANLTKSNNESNLELVYINGTWHMVDLNICYKIVSLNSTENDSRFYNHSHFNKINSELNMWFEQHVKVIKNSQNQKGSNQNFASALWKEFIKEKQKKLRSSQLKNHASRIKSLQARRNLRAIETENSYLGSASDKEIYPISIYDTQSRLYENFARTVRTRDDTFYYVSFRRDHVIFPVINQNKVRRPKVSLIVPSMFHSKKTINESSESTSHENDKKLIQFIQIDCEVLDTKLFYLNSDDLPHDYIKILNLEDIPNGFNY